MTTLSRSGIWEAKFSADSLIRVKLPAVDHTELSITSTRTSCTAAVLNSNRTVRTTATSLIFDQLLIEDRVLIPVNNSKRVYIFVVAVAAV